jgi:Flp pilus assembly protein TadB
LEKISPSYQRNVQGQDVTEEYVDLSSRLKAKQVVETRLLAFMDKATKTDDLLAFSNELSKVQGEIELIKGRMRYLDQNVSYSTVELRMYQQTGSKSPFDPNKGTALSDRLQKAWIASLNVLAVVLQGILVFLAAALPILLLAALVLIPAFYYRRKRNQRLAETRNQLKQQNTSISSALNEPTDPK